ncbi:hypothetical protein A3728_04930 [Sulfitobacter sp. HI0040]|jgi:hypothetical protein|nr:hypothetical protein A3721_02335 [Sulfitobacter sp. HI0023]KZY24612.1 hypothetical protein A3728_04930 [Sulfitobacter sp. HI0040]KZZ67944.1 hypothetical protein A3764_13965 [Sulfitobacter sp. HI0129]
MDTGDRLSAQNEEIPMRYYEDQTYPLDDFADLAFAEHDGPSDPSSPQAVAEYAASLTPATKDRENRRKAVFRDAALTSMLQNIERLRAPEQTGVAYIYGFLKSATEENRRRSNPALPQVNDRVVKLATELYDMSFRLKTKTETGELIGDCVARICHEHNRSDPR